MYISTVGLNQFQPFFSLNFQGLMKTIFLKYDSVNKIKKIKRYNKAEKLTNNTVVKQTKKIFVCDSNSIFIVTQRRPCRSILDKEHSHNNLGARYLYLQ